MNNKQLLNAYQRGENIMALLKENNAEYLNTEEMIETAYDLQAGSYVDAIRDPKMYKKMTAYGDNIAKEIVSLTKPKSILEVGVGEALSRKAVVFEMLLRDAIVGTYIELVLLVESLRIAHGQVATEQIVLARTIGIGTLAEHTTGGLIYFGVERRVLGRQEVVGRATGVGDT